MSGLQRAAANNLRVHKQQEGGTFELVLRNWIRRAQAFTQVNGENFEHFLWKEVHGLL